MRWSLTGPLLAVVALAIGLTIGRAAEATPPPDRAGHRAA
jgi:hypothetical protein